MPTTSVTRKDFFFDCAEHEFADAEGGRTFYFRLAEVPTTVKALYSRTAGQDRWDPWWVEYLTLKYRAMALLNRRPRSHVKTILKHVSLSEDYADVVARWRELAPVERRVFRLRLDQIDDLETVQATWYDDIPGFSDWAESCNERPVDLQAPAAQRAAIASLHSLLGDRAAEIAAEDDVDGRHVVELLEDLRVAGDAHLAGADREDVFLGPTPDGASSVDPVAIIIAQQMLDLRTRGEMRLDKYVDVLLTVVKAQFRARVADFLLLRKRQGREQLELLGTTGEISPEELYALESDAAYTRPTGITGSVLVAQRHNALFHVGTNDLQHDPRQSHPHRGAYAKFYGDLENFWVFPIYVKSGFLGAVRVVDRLDDQGKVVRWPYLVRRRLAGLLSAVAVFFEGCELPAEHDQPGAESAPRIADFVDSAADNRARGSAELVAREALAMDGPALQQLLDSLAALSEIRIEDRWLTFTTLVIGDDRVASVRDLVPASTYRPQRAFPALAELDRWSLHHPGVVMVVTAAGTLLGSLSIAPPASAPESLSRQHGVDLVLIQGATEERRIELWRGGEHLADYAFLPRLGTWLLRDFARGRDALSAKVLHAGQVLDVVFRHAVAISYDHGSSILLLASEDVPDKLPFSHGGQPVGESISTLRPDQFSAHATRDGAAVVSWAGVVESAEETLPNEPPDKLSNSMRKTMEETQQLLRASLRGTRHGSALTASLHFPHSVVFCASENRTVCAFIAGEAVLWDF